MPPAFDAHAWYFRHLLDPQTPNDASFHPLRMVIEQLIQLFEPKTWRLALPDGPWIRDYQQFPEDQCEFISHGFACCLYRCIGGQWVGRIELPSQHCDAQRTLDDWKAVQSEIPLEVYNAAPHVAWVHIRRDHPVLDLRVLWMANCINLGMGSQAARAYIEPLGVMEYWTAPMAMFAMHSFTMTLCARDMASRLSRARVVVCANLPHPAPPATHP